MICTDCTVNACWDHKTATVTLCTKHASVDQLISAMTWTMGNLKGRMKIGGPGYTAEEMAILPSFVRLLPDIKEPA